MAETAAPVCVWLKRDLRVGDHPALAEAVARSRGGCVFAVFLYEPEVLAQEEWHSSHTEFQRECLVEMEAQLGRLGMRLVTRRGEAVAMAFVRLLAGLEPVVAAGVPAGLLERRYGTPVLPRSDREEAIPDASAWLEAASSRHTSGDTARMAQRLLDDFRRGVLGPIALELPLAEPVAEPVA